MEEKNKITDEQVEDAYSKGIKKAEKLLEDEDKIERFFQRLEKKLKKVPLVGNDLIFISS